MILLRPRLPTKSILDCIEHGPFHGLVGASLPELKRETVSPPELIEENNDELETTIPSEDLPAPVHLSRTDSHLGRLMTQVSIQ